MAGINSVGNHMFLLLRAGDDGMRLLNEARLWVSLMEAYGFDQLSGDISTRKPLTERVDIYFNGPSPPKENPASAHTASPPSTLGGGRV
jgi:hypothetical protein